jgi:hypothetical protein
MFDHHLTIRAARQYELDVLSRLAGRDGRHSYRGHALLAERDGIAIAAIALTSGSVLTDRRHATGDAVRLLRLRRYKLLRQGGDVAPASSLLRRLAPAGANLRLAVEATDRRGHRQVEPDAGSIHVGS